MTLFIGENTTLAGLQDVLKMLRERWAMNSPIAKQSKEILNTLLNSTSVLPEKGCSLSEILQEKIKPLMPHLLDVTHAFTAAHLHCRTLETAVLSELIIASFNLSMDSWDQSGVATAIEQQVIQWLVQLLGYPSSADGVFTSGGTQSNLMGVLLGREMFAKKRSLQPFTKTGMHQPLTILCTKQAHFSVQQAARWLGMGSDNVIVIDPENPLIPKEGNPAVFVATAGCTDFGKVDPLTKIREFCDKYQLWMHVDAAVGGALLLTDQKNRLKGIEKADSVTIDFHKLFFQPISASVFMVKQSDSFSVMNFYSDYLNRESDEKEGTVNLVSKSMQTTRRFDALKIWLTWQHLGLDVMKNLINTLLSLTIKAADIIQKEPLLELALPPSINTVVFRFHSAKKNSEEINRRIRRELFHEGLAVIGETVYQNQIFLKLTLMNPECTEEQLIKLFQLIIEQGKSL